MECADQLVSNDMFREPSLRIAFRSNIGVFGANGFLNSLAVDISFRLGRSC